MSYDSKRNQKWLGKEFDTFINLGRSDRLMHYWQLAMWSLGVRLQMLRCLSSRVVFPRSNSTPSLYHDRASRSRLDQLTRRRQQVKHWQEGRKMSGDILRTNNQYEAKFLVWKGNQWRCLQASECVRQLGFPEGYLETDNPLSEDSKRQLMGDAMAVRVFVRLIASMPEAPGVWPPLKVVAEDGVLRHQCRGGKATRRWAPSPKLATGRP